MGEDHLQPLESIECRDIMKSPAGKIGGAKKIVILISVLCIWSGVTDCQMAPSLLDYTPKSGPIAGGTEINVTGVGFVTTGSGRSKCKFERSSRGATLSEQNILYNQTFLTCYLPEIEYLTDSTLQGGEMVRFTITGAPGNDSNSVEFFLYDLEQIRIWSISPTEGLANSTNITLSVGGENFLDTNELTCSVAGSYKVPAQYINSSLLQCQLAPFPETARVIIDVSMNGQALANIAPLMENSTTFIYFSSPPRVQSCRFTLSYAQLILSFDREVEIGGKQRTNDTILISSTLSCKEIFAQETLQNVIGLNSICFWYNTQQRDVIVKLASDTLVELGSEVIIKNDTIRTRYVQYSQLASGNTMVSLPETGSPQFLPVAVIEAPSVIPYCGNFTISGAKSQYGGSRGLQYMWIIGTRYDENGTLIQDSILADHIPTGFTSQSVLELSSDVFNPDLLGSGSGSGAPLMLASSFDIQLHVRNFLGFTSTARVPNITRAEIAQPSVLIVGGDSRRVRISDETILEARVILPSDACLTPMQELNEHVTYTWRIIDQFGKAISLGDTSHSTVLVLPPYLLELGLEYTATLSVDFNSVTIEASATLITDVELFNLVTRISGGVRRSIGTNEDILLDGRQSQHVNTSSLVLDITWRCAAIALNEECISQNGHALSFSTNSLVQIIPSGTLQPGEYNFSLILQLMSDSQDSLMLESSAYQVVVVFPIPVPRVEIVQADNIGMDLESVLVHNELILNVGVQSNSPGIGQWTSEYVIGYAQLDLNDDTTRSPLRYNITDVSSGRPFFSETMPLLFTNDSSANSFVNQIAFIIAGNTLLPQNSYRFKFTTYNVFNNSGFAEIDITTESVPISGRLLINPQNGSPLTTVFSLSAPSWTDNFGDTPLLYQFGLRYIFFNLIESSNSRQLLPSCCNLLYDNSSFSISKFENVSCVCDFFSTGVSEQNDLQTMLPFLPQTMNRVPIQVELLVHVFDKNGARTETSQNLDSIFTEPMTDDDSIQLLRPMLDSPSREQLDIIAMLDRLRQLSRSNWRDALAQLTTLVSFAEVSSFNSPYFNLSQTQMVQFKVKATEIVLDIYEAYIPHSKPYLNVIASLLQSTTGSLNSALNDESISRIIDFIRVLVDSYNNFDVEQFFSLPGFSTTESQIVLKILQNLISTGSGRTSNSIARIRVNSVTQELLNIIPKLGFGLCTSERHSFVDGASSSFLKASQTNLPTDYQSIEQCSARQANSRKTRYCLGEDQLKVTVNFSSALFERYLWWPCAAAIESDNAESELYCSGVCMTTAQHKQNLLWQGNEYEAQLKSPLFQLYLLNPQNGSILEASAGTLPPTRVARNVAPDSEQIDLVFPILASYSDASNLQCVYWNGTSRMWIRRSHFTGEMKLRNGTVTDIVCQFGVALGSIFTVLEICPDGYYGETCSNICPEGMWGGECRGSCDCSNRGDCSPVDGSCDCEPGWTGDSCGMKCPAGVWGKGCLEVCLCENGAECDYITGECTCTPGWMGTYCNICKFKTVGCLNANFPICDNI